jgi:hypothetical protein
LNFFLSLDFSSDDYAVKGQAGPTPRTRHRPQRPGKSANDPK